MVLYYKNNYTVFPKAKSYDGSVDIIFISNATKFAFVIGDAALVDDNEVYREFDMNFPANAPYGEYTYVIAPHTQFSDKWVLKNEILDSLYEGTVLRDVMLETGLLIFVDEEEKAQPEYRERDKKQNESNFIYRKRKELEEKEPVVPPTPPEDVWYTYYLDYVYPENATVRIYTDTTMTVEITDLQRIPYASIYIVGEAEGYMSSGKVFNGVPNSFVFVDVLLGENPYPPYPVPIYWYNVGVVSEDGSPIESVITYYTDETMTEVIEGADLVWHSSIYVYVEADGYEPQGQLLIGIPDGNVYVEFKLEKVVPPTPELKYSYAVGSVVPETATVKWYKDSSMTVEVTELIEIDDSSLYVYAEAEGYKPQGKTVNGRLGDIMIVDFALNRRIPEDAVVVGSYTTTDGEEPKINDYGKHIGLNEGDPLELAYTATWFKDGLIYTLNKDGISIDNSLNIDTLTYFTIVKGVTFDNSVLEKVTLPSTFKRFSDNVGLFSECHNLKEVWCYADEVPVGGKYDHFDIGENHPKDVIFYKKKGLDYTSNRYFSLLVEKNNWQFIDIEE